MHSLSTDTDVVTLTCQQFKELHIPVRVTDIEGGFRESATGTVADAMITEAPPHIVDAYYHNLWTIIDNNDGSPWVVRNGLYGINRIGYVITHTPYTVERGMIEVILD